MMNKKIMLVALCSIGFAVGCNQATDHHLAHADEGGRSVTLPAKSKPDRANLDANTLLTVNNQPITRAMFEIYLQTYMRSMPGAKITPELQNQLVNQLASTLVVAQEAKKSGLQNLEQVKASLELAKAKILAQVAYQEFTKQHQPTDEQVRQVYDAKLNKSTTEFMTKHIVVKTQDEAFALIAELDKGADFVELAKKHSIDATRESGGDLGWIDPENMLKPPFADALNALEKGTYSTKPVKTKFGFHIILVEDRRVTPAPSFDSVKSKIVRELQQKALLEYVQGLLENSKLVLNKANAQPQTPSAGEAPSQAPADKK
jgi:peptidyl-prolyl cis-trans isomerase C